MVFVRMAFPWRTSSPRLKGEPLHPYYHRNCPFPLLRTYRGINGAVAVGDFYFPPPKGGLLLLETQPTPSLGPLPFVFC